MTFVFFNCNYAEREIIAVQEGYTGYVLIIFNQENGDSIKYIDSKRVYEIPQDGILRTQFQINEGLRELPEYYSGDLVYENKLSSHTNLGEIPIDTVVGLIGANGSFIKDFESKERIEFSKFFIGTKSQIESSQRQLENLDITSFVN